MRITSSQGHGGQHGLDNIPEQGDKTKGILQHREERKQPPALPQEQQCGFLGSIPTQSIQENNSMILKYSITLPRGCDSGEKEVLDTTGFTKNRDWGLCKVCPTPNLAWQCLGMQLPRNLAESKAGMCHRE